MVPWHWIACGLILSAYTILSYTFRQGFPVALVIALGGVAVLMMLTGLVAKIVGKWISRP